MSEFFNRHEPGFNVLHQVSEQLYTFVTEFVFAGKVPIQNRSIVVHLPAGEGRRRSALAIINPAELHPSVEGALRRLQAETGAAIEYLISPGDWHYLFIGQHRRAFPEAKAYIPPGRIPSKNPDFEYTLIDPDLDNPLRELAPHLMVSSFKGLRDFTDPAGKLPRHELIFFFPHANALTSGDVLYYNGVSELSATQKAIGHIANRVDFHHMKQKLVLQPALVRRSLERILEWDFDRYISIHGDPGNMLERGAKSQIAQLVDWANELNAAPSSS
jgi:hypothetical protein